MTAGLCYEIETGQIRWGEHFALRTLQRAQPDKADIQRGLCEDDPIIIEPYPDDPRGRSCLILAMVGGRAAHIVCSFPPNATIITAYWPDLTPAKWIDHFRKRADPTT